MARDPFPPSGDSDSEEEAFEEEGDEQVVDDAQTEANSDDDAEEEIETEVEDEAEEEDESSEKAGSPVRGLGYGSDADSGKIMPSPSPYDFVVKENSEGKKKRAAECESVNEVKKKSNKVKKENAVVAAASVDDNVVAEDKAKRSSGQRIWGPEDELMIVKGILDYKKMTGVDFNSNLDAFYRFIKGQLNAIVDKSQLVSKIRKLKERFRNNAAKEANGGELMFFLNNHEAKVYEYSKKIWGGKAVAHSKSKNKIEKEVSVDDVMEVDSAVALPVLDFELSKIEVNGGRAKAASRVQKVEEKPKVVLKMEFIKTDVEMKEPVIPMTPMVDGMMFQKGLELVEKSKVDALNEKWTKYQLDAAELYVRKLDLIKEQTELVLDALKSR